MDILEIMNYLAVFKHWWLPHFLLSSALALWFGKLGIFIGIMHFFVISLVYIFVEKWIFYIFRAKPLDFRDPNYQKISNYLYRMFPDARVDFAVSGEGHGVWGPFGFGRKVVVISKHELRSSQEDIFSEAIGNLLGSPEQKTVRETSKFLFTSYFFIVLSLVLRKINASFSGKYREAVKWVVFQFAYSFFNFTRLGEIKVPFYQVKKALEEKNFSLFRNTVSYKG